MGRGEDLTDQVQAQGATPQIYWITCFCFFSCKNILNILNPLIQKSHFLQMILESLNPFINPDKLL